MNSSSRFLDLPAEIRNKIYRELLCFDGIMPESRWYWRWCNQLCDGFRTAKNPGSALRFQVDTVISVNNAIAPLNRPTLDAQWILMIFLTCRQIYNEAHVVFWSENAFVFRSEYRTARFLGTIGNAQQNLLRRIGLEQPSGERCFHDDEFCEWIRRTQDIWVATEIDYETECYPVRYTWFTRKTSITQRKVTPIPGMLNENPPQTLNSKRWNESMAQLIERQKKLELDT